MNYLFSYGTLRKRSAQIELFGRELMGFADFLDGYALAAIEIEDEAFLSKGEEKVQLTAIRSTDNKDVVEGMAFEITQEDLRLADGYEPDGYKRIKVELRSGKAAWVYMQV